MSDYDLSDSIEKIVDLANNASNLKAVKQVFDLTTGEKGVLLNDGSYLVVGTATKDEKGFALTAPTRISANPTVQTVDSLVDYIARFKTEGTVLFANISSSVIVAVLDYHVKPDQAGYREHTVKLALPHDVVWDIWAAIDGKLMPQLEFARFIEENGADIKAPSGIEMLNTVRDLQSKRNVNFIAAVRTASENESFEYSDKTDTVTKDGIEVPSKFTLSLPVYFGSREVELSAFLRNKVEDGRLHLGIKLSRAEQVRQAMFKEIVTDLAERAGVPVIYGPQPTS